ncbi:MAG: hypothetical protein WC683_07265 [bacterium]
MCLTLFVTGLIIDLFWTVAVRAAAHRQAMRAALASLILAVIQLGLTVAVFESPVARSIPGVASFALGSALGSYVIVRYGK